MRWLTTGWLRTAALLLAAASSVFAIRPATGLAAPTATTQGTAGRPTSEPTTQQVVREAAEKAAEKATEKVAEKAAEKVAEKAAEKAIEKAAEEKAAKEELKSKRPDEWFGPTEVRFYVFVVDIDEIDGAAQNFTANVYLRLRWQDRRLAKPGALPRQMPLVDVWNPRVVLANQQGLVTKSLPDVVQVDADGTVTYYQRYTGRLSQPLLLSDFPMDAHTFTVQFAAAGYAADELAFVPDTITRGELRIQGGAIAERLSVPDWKVLRHLTDNSAYSPVAGANTAGFNFRFEARRYVAYYLWQVVLPLAMVVVMSWAAFWVDTKNVGVRVGVATSSILTLIAYRFVLASLLPRLPYMTRMDYFTVGSTLLVLLALIIVLWTSVMEKRNRATGAERIDHWARAGFPAVFLLLLGWFMSGLWWAW
jgi:hypothetical protein